MGKMRKTRQSGFSFAESLITVTILAFVALGTITIVAKKSTFSQNVQAKHGSYECFRDSKTKKVVERYTYKGAPKKDGEDPKNVPSGADCAFVQPAYVNTICIEMIGGGGGASNGVVPADYKLRSGGAGESKSLCMSSVANAQASNTYTYKIKVGKGGRAGENGDPSIMQRSDNTTTTTILSVAGGITGKDVISKSSSDSAGEGISVTEDKENYGAGGTTGPGTGGYIEITW